MDEAREYIEQVEEGLDQNDIEVSEYVIDFAGNDLWNLGDDLDEVVDDIRDELSNRTSIHIQPEEPLSNSGERMYGSRITLRERKDGDLYFDVNLYPSAELPKEDEIYWQAKIEKSLVDQDLPVELE